MIARQRHRVAAVAWCAAVALLCSAHIGSPDTYYEGMAGPYPVRVIIRAPQVIPARAEVIVRVTGSGVQHVTAAPYIWNGGDKGAPPADELVRVAGDSTLWSVQLWIMASASYSVRVHVEGSAGAGVAVVPFTAVATQVLQMDRKMAIGLAAFGIFLIVGLVTIVGAASRESTLEPGTEPDAAQVDRSWRVRGAAVLLLAVFLGLGRMWWNAEDAAYARGIFQPVHGAITTRDEGPRRVLRFAIDPAAANARRWSPFIPDHGKLMHLFLVKAGDLGALAHLHPVMLDSLTFEGTLPPLPAGTYQVFADVVHESGFAETMVSTVSVAPNSASAWASDPDDAMSIGMPAADTVTVPDGSVLAMVRRAAPVVANEDAGLSFTVRDAAGRPADVEPYLGMAGHAVVVRDDGSVFVHLHPMGTASMGAQQALMARTDADTVRGAVRARLERNALAVHAAHETMPGTLSFPYAFPKAGTYRVWVQFRRGGAIRTGVFDVGVR